MARIRMCGVLALALMTPVVAGASEVCLEVQRSIDAQVLSSNLLSDQIFLAPYASVSLVPKLLEKTRSKESEEAFAAFLAIGLARHSDGLRRLRKIPPPHVAELRVAHSLSLLALGDGSTSATIANSLRSSPVELRRRVAFALSAMQQKRPRMLLYESLTDPDQAVRLIAAKVHVKLYSRRARRVLVDTLKTGTPDRKEEAAHALVERQIRFRSEDLALLPKAVRMQAVAQNYVRRRPSLRSLRLQALSSDPDKRTTAFAGIAAIGTETMQSLLRRVSRLAKKKHGETAEAQAIMARALFRDEKAIARLGAMTQDQSKTAMAVLWAFSGSGAPHNQFESEHAQEIARAIEPWIVRGLLDAREQSRAIQAMEIADPIAGLILARARLLGPVDEALQTALMVVGRSGNPRDLPQIMGAAQRAEGIAKSEARALALHAAARVCLR